MAGFVERRRAPMGAGTVAYLRGVLIGRVRAAVPGELLLNSIQRIL